MMKTLGKITLAAILAAIVTGAPVRVCAQDTNTNKPVAPPRPRAPRTPSFRGTLDAVDNTAKTISVANPTMKDKRIFEITSDTKIMKDGKPAMLSDGVVGEEVRGSYTNSAGKMIAKTLYFGKSVPPKTSLPKTNAPPS